MIFFRYFHGQNLKQSKFSYDQGLINCQNRISHNMLSFLRKNGMCISMELVTAVLGDHGQRPLDDYGEVFFFYRCSESLPFKTM